MFLLEGDYDENSAMTAAPEAVTATEMTTEDLADYFSKGGFPAMVIDREVVEQWKITFTDDGRSEHTLRYLAPSGKPATSGSMWRTTVDGSGQITTPSAATWCSR